MNVTIVYGTNRKGCTYHMAKQVLAQLQAENITEFYLPEALPDYCISCFRCFTEAKGTCAHSAYTTILREKLLQADVIILTSPVYSYHLSGQMKVFLDHFANMWMVHRPEEKMFTKQGIVISSASGPVYHKTLNEMKDSLDFWGVSKTYKLGTALMETRWDKISPKIKAKLEKKSLKTARKIRDSVGHTRPSFRVRKWFYVSRMMQKLIKVNPTDVDYWQEKGWLSKARPWKNKA